MKKRELKPGDVVQISPDLPDCFFRGCYMTVTEARQFALTVLAAADAAESDAFLFGFCKKVGMPEDAQARLIMAFRNYRAEQFEKENPA